MEKTISIWETPLHCSAKNGHLCIVNYLVNHRVDVNASNINNKNALHCSVTKGRLNVIEFLVNHGFDINHLNKKGKIPLKKAKDPKIIEFLK